MDDNDLKFKRATILVDIMKMSRDEMKGLQDKAYTFSTSFVAGSFAISAFLLKEKYSVVLAAISGICLVSASAFLWYRFKASCRMARLTIECHEKNLLLVLHDQPVENNAIVKPEIPISAKPEFPMTAETDLLFYTVVFIFVQSLFVCLYLYCQSISHCCC